MVRHVIRNAMNNVIKRRVRRTMVTVPMDALVDIGNRSVMKNALETAKMIRAILQHLTVHLVAMMASLGTNAIIFVILHVLVVNVIKIQENVLRDA